jgi:4-carboxymuconolactone decarboxylase
MAPIDCGARSEEFYEMLFGPRDPSVPENDPELMTILRRLVFGEVFYTGDLDDQTRELITVVVLTTDQMLSQLAAHTSAALNVGVAPVEVWEAVDQCAPFVGFPVILDAMATVSDVFRDRGIELPLPCQATVGEADRYDKGRAIQFPLYGDEIRDTSRRSPTGSVTTSPGCSPSSASVTSPRAPDSIWPGGNSWCSASSPRSAEPRPNCAHALGNIKVGNDGARQITGLIHCFPYIGFPRSLDAIRIIEGS